MGRTDEALDDFQVFLAWVDSSVQESCRQYYRPSRETWVTMLKSGGDPFDPRTLGDLRVRPVTSR